MSPREANLDRAALLACLAAGARRLRVGDVLRGVAAGATFSAVTLLGLAAAVQSYRVAVTASALTGLSAALATVLRRRRRWTTAEAALAAERARPESRNVIVTAEELLHEPGAGRPAVRSRVFADAASAIEGLAPARAIPLRGPAIVCAAALITLAGAWAALPFGTGSAVPEPAAPLQERGRTPGPFRVTATITPPSYLAASVRRLADPERIEAVAGSRLALQITDGNQRWRIRLGAKALETATTGIGAAASAELSESTYLAIESESDLRDARRLIPIVVTPDHAPTIVLEQPGKDLLFPDSTATIPIAASATDDFGMESLELRFTRVSGSGEQFSFEEGVVPLRIDRESARSWTGRGSLALDRMGLDPGDAVVYRVVGSDARPLRAGLASSDTFFVEIAGPDRVAPAGLELPPERERYALSQQMIVVRIRRLRSRESSISRESLSEEAASIAAEQRAVRASFIFLTGGHVEDEEEEAARSHEIQEGRLEHSARKEITTAIQHMSQAEQALAATDTGAALRQARAAVEALERAFGRARYFMRTLPSRSRLDPSRRLTGSLDEASDSRRIAGKGRPSPGVQAARELVVDLLAAAPALKSAPRTADPHRITSMAERALSVGAGSRQWQQIAAAFLQLRDAVASGRPAPEIEAKLQQVMDGLQAEAQRDAISPVRYDRSNHALRSAWSEQRGRR